LKNKKYFFNIFSNKKIFLKNNCYYLDENSILLSKFLHKQNQNPISTLKPTKLMLQTQQTNPISEDCFSNYHYLIFIELLKLDWVSSVLHQELSWWLVGFLTSKEKRGFLARNMKYIVMASIFLTGLLEIKKEKKKRRRRS